MKQETNNEMDLLLRRLERRPDVFVPDAEDHLDADELSAYAENMLPAKARARYTEHLAECSGCRGLVMQLSASAGLVVVEPPGKVLEPSGWKKFLAGLFSPMVLKYAAPALALIVVAAIGLIVLRRERGGEFVSQTRPTNVAEDQVESKTQPEAGILSDNRKAAESTANKDVQPKESVQQAPAPAPSATPADVETSAPVAKAPEPKPETQPAAEPPPPAPAKTDVANEKRKTEDASRKQEAEVKVASADESKKNFEYDGVSKRADATPSATARTAKSKSPVGDLSAAQGAAAPGGPRRAREEAGRDDKDSGGETRTVAGRRFRKQDGVWVDTAYNSGGAFTTYPRNSESYRALIADEPAIKTIADQLDGEIIVVWKGRAYRIR